MESILDLYMYTDIWLLVFVRIVAVISVMPVILETKMPATVVAILSIVLTMIVFFTIPQGTLAYTESFLGYGILIIREILVGLVLGFGILIFFQVLNFTGQLWSNQGGLSMSQFFDATIGAQIPVLGRFLTLGFSTLFIVSGGYHYFISALVKTFEYIPVGAAIFNPSISITILDAVAIFFELGFRLATPILGVILLIDVGLGILARTVPQMNMFVIGLPLKSLILITLLIVIINYLPEYSNIIINYMKNTYFELLEGLNNGI
ncbi:flagellar biosynthetic protein FliR [Candidatus Epulonipiscioides gigas]|nr:flagellar biosynthetic protein FliR [Epulopiscium sp. SCG-C07WGA-EpuloA2]